NADDDGAAREAELAGELGEVAALFAAEAQDFGDHGHDDAVGAAIEEPVDFLLKRGGVDGFIVAVWGLKNRQDTGEFAVGVDHDLSAHIEAAIDGDGGTGDEFGKI